MRHGLFAVVLGMTAAATAAAPAAGPGQEQLMLGRICGGAAPAPIAGPHRLVMLPYMGNDHMAADTRRADAQRWFDYGLTLGRSFEHADAVLAFRKAETLDPGCSLCVWGEAWAGGGTINFPVGPEQTRANLALAKRAQQLAGPATTPPMRRLEAALIDRYQGGDEGRGDKAWARDMDALHAADRGDVELAVFDAEAQLIRGREGDRSGAKKALAAVQPLVAAHPDHTGLVHFFIHASEEAGQAALAEPYVARMAGLASGASHMVHMPSHTYFRVGRYQDAALANVAALKVDRAYAEKTGFPTPLGAMAYHFHDLQFGLGGALMSGDGKVAMQLVRQFNTDFPNPAAYNPRDEGTAAQTYAALGRFGRPDQVLAAPDTVASNPFLEGMRHYARGLAQLRLDHAAAARAEAAQVSPAGNPGKVVTLVQLRIARLTLQGDAEMTERRPQAAAALFRQAAALQEATFADSYDPPRWWFPVRRRLAAALLAQGDAKGGAREAQRVLTAWPHDPVSLQVLGKAQAALHDPEAAAHLAEAHALWRGDRRELEAAG